MAMDLVRQYVMEQEAIKMKEKAEREREAFSQSLQTSQNYTIENANKKELIIREGVPYYLYTDSYGVVSDLQVANEMDYATRNELYSKDRVLFNKLMNGDFKDTKPNAELKAQLQGLKYSEIGKEVSKTDADIKRAEEVAQALEAHRNYLESMGLSDLIK